MLIEVLFLLKVFLNHDLFQISISDLWFKCLKILFLILSNSNPAFLISNAPEGLYSSTSSPLPNLSDASANLVIGLV